MTFKVRLAQFYGQVKRDLDQVNDYLDQQLSQTQLSTLRKVNRYLLDAPGKRLRPLFAGMCFRHATNQTQLSDDIIQYGGALELIHMASLIHDDIIDEADQRHAVPTIHTKWGVGVAIPVGVYYYARCLGILTQLENMTLVRSVSHAVKHLCEGELDQVFERFNGELSVNQHLIMIRKKTAALFEVAGYGAGLLASVPNSQAFVYKSMGYCLGMMFQISDDYLDIMDQNGQLHKSLGQDLLQGDMTLPILYVLQSMKMTDSQSLMTRIQEKDLSVIDVFQTHCKTPNIRTKLTDLFEHYKNRYIKLTQSIEAQGSTQMFSSILGLIEARMQ